MRIGELATKAGCDVQTVRGEGLLPEPRCWHDGAP